MDDRRNKDGENAPAPVRPRLTIVPNLDVAPAAPVKARVSPFVSFMAAYADAIDREVKIIMDL